MINSYLEEDNLQTASSPQSESNFKVASKTQSTVQNAKPGKIITYGTYPQTADGADVIPIKWRVLQNSGSELFILSEYILDSKRYHSDFLDITRDSDLRRISLHSASVSLFAGSGRFAKGRKMACPSIVVNSKRSSEGLSIMRHYP